MTPDIFRAAIAAHWGSATDGAHDLGHLDRVWANAKEISTETGGADLAVLLPAAYFHDAVNLPKNHPDRARASTASAEWATAYLAGTDFPAAKIPAVAHAIAAHSFSAAIAPETLEAEILQDADRLEALGAIGIARMFHVGGAMGGLLFDAADPMALNRPLDDKRYSLDHLEVKLFPIAQTMRTSVGREMALARVEWMRSFRSRLLRELG
ncbi:HD domain-containing protein [Pseudorhodobacter ferrugineus]|uniref:HD domain-containing protein n=1 Tax=Pseudorhodobacter ferrugineus TaxID=77008 RepID=UPI0003B5ED1F|nr:HD domain-containing protein [Pseudorhodobacter ferrugineus]